MPAIIPDRGGRRIATAPLWKRVAWFVALYILGVLAVGIVAYGLRLWIKPAPKPVAHLRGAVQRLVSG